MNVKLECNAKKEIWTYKYIIRNREDDLNLLELIKSDDENDLFVAWVLTVDASFNYLFRLFKSATNDSDLDDIIQDSYIAFIENIDKLREADSLKNFKSRFINYTKFLSAKNNIHGRDISDKKRKRRYDAYLEDHFILRVDQLHDDGRYDLKVNIEEIKGYLTKEEFDTILKHFHLGKAFSTKVHNIKTNITYKRKIDRILDKARGAMDA